MFRFKKWYMFFLTEKYVLSRVFPVSNCLTKVLEVKGKTLVLMFIVTDKLYLCVGNKLFFNYDLFIYMFYLCYN